MDDLGKEMHRLCGELFPICRSITGNGVRKTLCLLKDHLPELKIYEIPTGEVCFDWNIPKEWNIRDAYVIDPEGNKIIDFQNSNLHVVGYSIPVNKTATLEELQEHLYSLPDQPTAIPYITSYYEERWGFCISEKQRRHLKPGKYHVYIDSDLSNGSLTYGELILQGHSEKEVFLSTYICHPSLANNELSGPVVTTFIAEWLAALKDRRFTYRIIFIPEGIGSIAYLSRHLEMMKQRVIAGFNVTCIGDDRSYSYLPSRNGNTLSDQVALHVMKHMHPDYIAYTYLDRGSDERQYCSPGVDLPVSSVMRSKYGEYPEYHTSLDDLHLITPSGLRGGYEVLLRCIHCIEQNETLKLTVLCEPQLGKRGLYPTLSTKESGKQVRDMMNLIAYSDGKHSLLDIADEIGVPMWNLCHVVDRLRAHNLLAAVE
jgi:aminopeptidase-like protein